MRLNGIIIKNLVVMEKSERKIKWNALASFLLALLLCAGAAGCSDDEEENEPREEIIIFPIITGYPRGIN